jgi:outer membrane lipoprotein SlyB
LRNLAKAEDLEIRLRLNSGGLVAVVQESCVWFSPGDRVQVLSGSDGTMRVRK